MTDYREFNKKHSVDAGRVRSGCEESILYDNIRSGLYYIQRLVRQIHEFRVLYFHNAEVSNYIVEYRDGYLPGSNHTPTRTTDIPKCAKEYIPRILEHAKQLGVYLNKPGVSMDFYVTDNGDIGMFEYSFEFGLDYEEGVINKVSKMYSKAIVSLLK